jgi:hypothetical protein
MTLPQDYLERVYAGVLGKIIGVYLGRPFEGGDENVLTDAASLSALGDDTIDHVHQSDALCFSQRGQHQTELLDLHNLRLLCLASLLQYLSCGAEVDVTRLHLAFPSRIVTVDAVSLMVIVDGLRASFGLAFYNAGHRKTPLRGDSNYHYAAKLYFAIRPLIPSLNYHYVRKLLVAS